MPFATRSRPKQPCLVRQTALRPASLAIRAGPWARIEGQRRVHVAAVPGASPGATSGKKGSPLVDENQIEPLAFAR
jgi:hypothetical protein